MNYVYKVWAEIGWAVIAFVVGVATAFMANPPGEVLKPESLIPALVLAGFRAVAAALLAKFGPGTIRA